MNPVKEKFLEMIYEDLDNDEPRLVYADYLMEQGDPEGEFIALQCEFDKARRSGDWGTMSRIEPRMKELDPEPVKSQKLIEYRRGFPHALKSSDQMRIDDAGAEFIARSEMYRTLKRLVLWNNHIGDDGAIALARSPYLTKLEVLDLGINRIGDKGAEAIAKSLSLRSLKVLSLMGNNIGDDGAKALAESLEFWLTNLRGLLIGENNIGFDGNYALRNSNSATGIEISYHTHPSPYEYRPLIEDRTLPFVGSNTEEILKIAHKNDAVIICPFHVDTKILLDYARNIKMKIQRPVEFHSAPESMIGLRKPVIFFNPHRIAVEEYNELVTELRSRDIRILDPS